MVIYSSGFADHWYFWRDTPSALQRRVVNRQEYLIDVARFVDTGLNSIVNVRVEAHPNPNWPEAEDPINGQQTYCSGELDVHRE